MGNAGSHKLGEDVLRADDPVAALVDAQYNYVRVENAVEAGRRLVASAMVAESKQLSHDIDFGDSGS